MTPASFHIREARLPQDIPAIHDFILGLQRFEYAFESNRRLDTAVAADYFAALHKKIRETDGAIFIAEDDLGHPVGWTAAHEDTEEIYVVPDKRRVAYIAELYVVEEARRLGIGRNLIQACEEWARRRSLSIITIGVLSKNSAAFQAYANTGYRSYGVLLRKNLP